MENIINVPEAQIRTKETIITEIKTTINHVNQTALVGAVIIGKGLKELKKLLQHGEWLNYIEESLNFSERKVRQFIQIADNYGDETTGFYRAISNRHTCADLSFSSALRLLTIEENEVEKFVENNDVTEMTVKELEEQIKALKQEKNSSENELVKIKDELLQTNNRLSEAEENIYKLENEEQRYTEEEQADIEAKAYEIEKLQKEQYKLQIERDKLKASVKSLEEQNALAIKLKSSAVDVAVQKAREETKEETRETIKKEFQETIDQAVREKEEALKHAEKIEQKLNSINNEEIIKIKIKVDELQQTYNEIIDYIDNMATTDNQQADKLKSVLKNIINSMEDQL